VRSQALPGPTGESNYLSLHGRGIALCLGGSPGDSMGDGHADGGAHAPVDVRTLALQTFVALAAGNAVALIDSAGAQRIVSALHEAGLDPELAVLLDRGVLAKDDDQDGAGETGALLRSFPQLALVVFDGPVQAVTSIRAALAGRSGRRVVLLSVADDMPMFAAERVVSIDTTASGGNATLLTLDDN
jgi:RHH-type proline utilization regulon transcriptional repressor/proline dehydrogenase/delta 1-pyrroline-5-carboxylate dehydrogenase